MTQSTSRFVVVGNGVAGIEAARTLRKHMGPEQAHIEVISEETPYFFSRTALMYAYMNTMQRKDLEPYERHHYDTWHISLRQDRVSNLDAHSKTLTLASGEQVAYDKLLLATGAKPRPIQIEGMESVQSGLVNFVSMGDLNRCEALTPSTRQAVVVGGGLIGIELAECLAFHGVKVHFMIREPFYWPAALCDQEAQLVHRTLEDHGVTVHLQEELAVLHADPSGRIARVETSLGNTIECQMLGVCIGVVPNTEWLADCTTTPKLDRGLWVDRAFRTSLPDVWGAGDCTAIDMPQGPLKETIWYSAKRHGALAAQSMLGHDITYTPPTFFNSSKFVDIEYTTVGNFRRPDDQSILHVDAAKRRSFRIAFAPQEGHRVTGFNMLGSRWNHEILQKWVDDRLSVDTVIKHLEKAQFDVEFGATSLLGLRRAYTQQISGA